MEVEELRGQEVSQDSLPGALYLLPHPYPSHSLHPTHMHTHLSFPPGHILISPLEIANILNRKCTEYTQPTVTADSLLQNSS